MSFCIQLKIKKYLFDVTQAGDRRLSFIDNKTVDDYLATAMRKSTICWCGIWRGFGCKRCSTLLLNCSITRGDGAVAPALAGRGHYPKHQRRSSRTPTLRASALDPLPSRNTM